MFRTYLHILDFFRYKSFIIHIISKYFFPMCGWSENVFSLYFWRIVLVGVEVLVDRFCFVLLLSILNISLHCFLTSIGLNERLDPKLLFFPLHAMSCFIPLAFTIFSLSFNSETRMDLGLGLFMFLLILVHLSSLINRWIIFSNKFSNFLVIIYSNVFAPFPLSPLCGTVNFLSIKFVSIYMTYLFLKMKIKKFPCLLSSCMFLNHSRKFILI